MKIDLTDDEVLYLHNIIVHKIHANDMPECTWEPICFTCNLYDKMYQAYVKVRDSNED